MRDSKSTAKPNTVEVCGLLNLYANALAARGYRPSVVGVYCAAVQHFISWAAPDKARLEVTRAAIRRFIDEHLPDCTCPGRVQRWTITVRAALDHLLMMVVGARLNEQAPKFPAYIATELREFCRHARNVSGLAPATLISRRQWVGQFLIHRFPKDRIDFSGLRPRDMQDFFTAQCQGYRPGTAHVIASAIRSYLRFRALEHADSVESLLAAIPSAACWRLAALPGYLEADELTTLMAAFDRKRPQHRRDYAIVRCMVDLGLRACEVAALRLDDIDWKNGTLAIRVGKAQRADVLPLPSITGQAIAEYLHNGRPTTESRSVFLRHRAPLDVPVNPSVIRSVVRQAATRSGLTDRPCGPHRLRHSAATQMLHAGASLKEIADILRHRSLDTTAIYAKVDFPRLASIAQPWPGGAE